MRPSRRQTQPFIRRWPAGRLSATALLVASGVGAFVAQALLTYVLAEHDQKDLLWHWLALDRAGLQAGHYWKFLTYPLLHQNPVHLIGNMLLLYFAGREVEPIIGARHFAGIYALGTIVGGAVQCLVMPDVPVVGASAAVTAIVVAFTTILPELEVTVLMFFVLPLRLRAKYLTLALVVMSGLLWATFTVPMVGPAGMLAASVLAWFYVKQLGFGNPLAIQRYIFNRRQRAARLDRMTPEQFISAEIDPILDKISRDGMHSLSRAERKILERGREKIATRAGRK
ncbi:MAG TPA: rhomboid family intramembrane serine protease [Chthoniobacteraceae bacterium]|jgi:membrane associated rhomboid family serine protease|nr:rhomboid family intramembrane serine protease [Chthoniobacteraceae bacterium]